MDFHQLLRTTCWKVTTNELPALILRFEHILTMLILFVSLSIVHEKALMTFIRPFHFQSCKAQLPKVVITGGCGIAVFHCDMCKHQAYIYDNYIKMHCIMQCLILHETKLHFLFLFILIFSVNWVQKRRKTFQGLKGNLCEISQNSNWS